MHKIKHSFFFVIIVLLLYFVYFVTYTFVEPRAYDFMTKYVLTERLPFDNHKQVYGHDDVILVMVDEKTSKIYRWPWKRKAWCSILNYFAEYAKPKVIAHDVILSASDADDPESDKKYFNSIKKIDNIVEGFMPMLRYSSNSSSDMAEEENDFVNNNKLQIEGSFYHLPELYHTISKMPADYFNSVKNFGSVVPMPGFIDGNLKMMDEVYRIQEPIFRYKESLLPSLAMQSFLVYNNYPKTVLSDDMLIFPEINRKIKLQKSNYLYFKPLKFYKMYQTCYSHPSYSVADIIESYSQLKEGKTPKLSPEIFKDKVVVIGVNVPEGAGLNDSANTPMLANHPGSDIQAVAIDNLIHEDFLIVVPEWVNIFLILLGMLFTYLIIKFYDLYKAIFGTIGIILIYLAAIAICFYNAVVLYVITPIVMFGATMIVAYINRYFVENKNKKKVEDALGKYMSEGVMKRVLQNIDNLGLGGKKSVVTVLFSDIRGFTSMSEKMEAEEVTAILNEYFSAMEPIVRKYNGIINKFIGDAIMAIFGEPINDIEHAKNAVRCGYEMFEKLSELQRKWKAEGKPEINIGIGINTGEVFVGNIGSENRMEYTVIGDTVNLASRLEGYNKIYGTRFLISTSTYEQAKDIVEANEITDVEIRGKAEKMNIYDVIRLK